MAVYTRVAYIESTGSQYIDAEVKANDKTRIIIDFETTKMETSAFGVYGSRDSGGAVNAFACFVRANAAGFNVNYGQGSNVFERFSNAVGRFTIDHNATILSVNGVQCQLTDWGTFQSNYNLFVLGVNQAGSLYNQSALKLYSCKIYEGTRLIRDFVPCRSSSGEYGLWDNVTKKYFGNQGTGAFVGGDVVILEKPTLPLGCTLIEYIESSGTQYIDTGFKPNNNTGVVIDFEPTSASAQSTAYSFFGTRAAKEDGEYFAFFKASSANFNLYWEFAELYDHIWNVANKADFTARRTVVVNGASATVGGVTKTYPARTFQTKLNMYLFADNEKGAVGYPAYMKLYSCQIYDNGKLVRDYVPIKDADGVCGLWDYVEGKFYGNAGSGSFTGGHKVVLPVPVINTLLAGFLCGLLGSGTLKQSITGGASGLVLAFDQSTLRLNITDTGVAGNSFTLVGDTLTVDGTPSVEGGVNDGLTTFKVGGNSYEVVGRMTWAEWIDSGYNTLDGLAIVDGLVMRENMPGMPEVGYDYIAYEKSPGELVEVKGTDIIVDGGKYEQTSRRPGEIEFWFWDDPHYAKAGMTWAEWLDSDYVNGWGNDMYIEYDRVMFREPATQEEYYVCYENASGELVYVTGGDLIVEGGTYTPTDVDPNAPSEPELITFSFEGKTYTAEAGMTWAEFINSEYNDGRFAANDDGTISIDGVGSLTENVTWERTKITDTIIPDAYYMYW